MEDIMKQRLSVVVLFLVAATLNTTSLAAPFDTGFRQWSQPNGVRFLGREWGDEFLWSAETGDGFRYVRTSDRWYYYAMLDRNGEFIATTSRVGIETPPAGSYKLERSAARLNAVALARAQFDALIDSNAQSFLRREALARTSSQSVSARLAVILVEFPNARHYDPGTPQRRGGYLRADFDSLLFSQGFWYAPAESLQYPSPHPEGHRAYGSMRDYWWQMSRGNGPVGALLVTGKVVNPQDSNAVPVWIEMQHPIESYDGETLSLEAKNTAIQLGYLDVSQFDYFAIVGAGAVFSETGAPQCYVTSEQRFGEFEDIGLHCHEFAHLLGFADDYTDITDPHFLDLMSVGCYNGPGDIRGECPAPPAPYYRVTRGWVTPIVLDHDVANLEVGYNYEHPIWYRINPLHADFLHDENFLIETRLRQGFDLYTPGPPNTFLSQSGTLLVWRNRSGTDYIALMPGSTSGYDLQWFFPGDRQTNLQDYNDFSSPVHPSFQDGELPHFAMNGIHRNTVTNLSEINSFLFPDGVGVIRQNAVWPSGVSQMNSDICILKGATLTIPAGAELVFGLSRANNSPPFGIYVYPDASTLVSVGTEAQRITFRASSPGRNKWNGISATGGGRIQIGYSTVRDARTALQSGSAFPDMNSLQVINCQSGLSVTSGHPTLQNCLFSQNALALTITTPEAATVARSTFIQNETGISIFGSSPQIQQDQFFNGTTELDLGEASSPLISHNLFVGNGTVNSRGIHMAGAATITPEIVNNTITMYRFGCLADPPKDGEPVAQPLVQNNIFYLNIESFAQDGGTMYGDGSLRFNNVFNSDHLYYNPPNTPPHVGNIEMIPLFSTDGTYSLQYFSPSIDAGDPYDSFDQEPEPNGRRINQGHQGNTPQATRSFTAVAGGSLTGNVSWSGNVLVQRDVVVEDGATLSIGRGSVVWVTPGSSILVYGTLLAQGVPGSPLDSVRFVRETAGSAWNGILFKDAPAGSVVQYCSISGAAAGISIEGTQPTIEHNLVANCDDGIDVYVAHPKLRPLIRYNEIWGCKYGMYVHNTPNTELRGNSVHDNDIGLYVFQSSPTLYQNVIERNRLYGVRSEEADPRFGGMVVDDRGCNTIRFNTTGEGTADFYASGGNPFLGFSDGQRAQGGFNSIYSDEAEGSRCIVIADKGSVITANANWWGVFPVSEGLFCAADGKVDYSYALKETPVECNSRIDTWTLPVDDEEQILSSAVVQRGQRSYAAALSTYTDFVANRPNSTKVRRALRELRQTYRDYRFSSNDSTLQAVLASYLTTVSGNHPNASLRLTAKMLLADELHVRHAWSAALTKYQQVIQAQPNTNAERVALFSVFAINAYGQRDTSAAFNTLQILRTKYPNDPHADLAEIRYAMLTRRTSGQMGKPTLPPADPSGTRPERYALDQNYPNPFNPTTIIQYQLPEDGHVVLKVYDVLGREVATLVNEAKEAGYYKVEYRASQLASGVYFYRLDAGSFTSVKKLLLLK